MQKTLQIMIYRVRFKNALGEAVKLYDMSITRNKL